LTGVVGSTGDLEVLHARPYAPRRVSGKIVETRAARTKEGLLHPRSRWGRVSSDTECGRRRENGPDRSPSSSQVRGGCVTAISTPPQLFRIPTEGEELLSLGANKHKYIIR